MYGFSKSAFYDFISVAKYGEIYPLSNFMPSTNSSSWVKVLPS